MNSTPDAAFIAGLRRLHAKLRAVELEQARSVNGQFKVGGTFSAKAVRTAYGPTAVSTGRNAARARLIKANLSNTANK